MSDLGGKVFVVTGATTGIGLATARELLRRGGRVVIAGRSEERGREAVAALRDEAQHDAIDFVRIDLASLRSVREGAGEILRREPRIHVLVNNAGIAAGRGRTEDGFELAFGTNHVGHFLLTMMLRDRLIASAPARVVVVASHAHYRAKGIPWDRVREKKRSLTGWPEYSVSKLANVLFARELAKKLEGTGVTVYALHPGVVASDLWRRVPKIVRPLVTRNMLTNEDGARTSIHCATAAELASETGLYYDEHARKKYPSRTAQRDDLAAELWARSAEWTRIS